MLVVLLVGTTADARRGFASSARGLRAASVKTYGPSVLTPKLLEDCLRVDARLNSLDRRLKNEQQGINREKSSLTLALQLLDKDRSRLDRTNKYEVETFNRRVSALNNRGMTLDAQIDRFNAVVEEQRQLVARFDTTCVGKQYYEDDLQAAKKKLNLS